MGPYQGGQDGAKLELDALNFRFARDFQSITWFTYRDCIERSIGSKITDQQSSKGLRNDSGWGCMLRTGQMILAQAIKRHVLYESFSLEVLKNGFMRKKYIDILRLFAENCINERDSPFGIHSIC